MEKKKEEKKFQQFLQTRLSARNFTFAADHIINGEIYAFQWAERIFHPYLRTNCCRVIPRDRWNKWKYRKLAPFSLSPWRGGGGGETVASARICPGRMSGGRKEPRHSDPRYREMRYFTAH